MAEALSGDYRYKKVDVVVLRKMYKDGYTAAPLAEFFGLSAGMIYYILNKYGIARRPTGVVGKKKISEADRLKYLAMCKKHPEKSDSSASSDEDEYK